MKIIRKNKILLAIVIVLMLSVFSIIPQIAIANEDCEKCKEAGSKSGNGVQPSFQCGNLTFIDFGINCDNTFKVEKEGDVTSDDYSDGVLDVTIKVTETNEGKIFEWTSNFPVNAVISKGGNCTNLFEYNSGETHDTKLHSPVNKENDKFFGLSHIDFCYSIEEPECPTCSIEPVEAVCEDGVEFTLHATVTGGTSPYEYSWSSDSGGTFSDSTIEDPTWTPPADFTGTATLTLTVTDDGCDPTTCTVDVTVYPKPDCAITAPDSVCDELTGNIASTIAGYSSYIWVIANGTITSGLGTDTIKFDITPGVTSVTLGVKVVDSNGCENTCSVTITVDPLPDCHITGDTEICDDETTTLCASDIARASYSWTGPEGFTSDKKCITVGVAGIYSVTITDECGESTCSVELIVKHCEKRPCECSLVVEKRDGDGNIIEDAVFKVDGIEKTTSGGEARWGDLECDTTYEVRELSPIEQTERIHLGDCGERSTMRVVNKIEVGELEVLGIMEVLPFTGPTIPYSPFIGISTVLAGTFLYILSKPKKKR